MLEPVAWSCTSHDLSFALANHLKAKNLQDVNLN